MRRESIYVARFTQTRQTEQFVVQPGILFDLLPPAGDFRFDPLLLGFSGQNVVLGIQELFVAAVRRRMPRTRFARQQDRLGRMPRIVVSAAQSAPVDNVVTQSPCQHTRIVVTRSRLRLVMRQQRRIHQIVGHCQSAVAGSPRCGPSTKNSKSKGNLDKNNKIDCNLPPIGVFTGEKVVVFRQQTIERTAGIRSRNGSMAIPFGFTDQTTNG